MKKEFKIKITKNKSITYMLPYLSEQVKFKFHQLILNTYLSFEKGDHVFCVMYSWNSSKEFIKHEGEIMKSHLFVGHQDYGDRVVYKFRLTRNMESGRDKFVTGKYKEFSQDHKDSIKDYLTQIGVSNVGRISQIMDPNFPDAKSTAPSMENETLEGHVEEVSIKPGEFIV